MSDHAFFDFSELLVAEYLEGMETSLASGYIPIDECKPFTTLSMPLGRYAPRMSCRFDDGEVEIQPGECWVIPPRVHYRFNRYDRESSALWAHMDFRLAPGWDLLNFFTVPPIFRGEAARKLRELMLILAQHEHCTWRNGEFHIDTSRRPPTDPRELGRMKSARYQMLDLILSQSTPKESWKEFAEGYGDFKPVLDLIHANLHRRIPLSELARSARCSQSAFEKKFRRVFGCAPGDTVLRVRLNRAAMLLYTRSVSLKEIAAATGFADRYAFGKAFRRQFGVPPGAYRERRIRFSGVGVGDT